MVKHRHNFDVNHVSVAPCY